MSKERDEMNELQIYRGYEKKYEALLQKMWKWF